MSGTDPEERVRKPVVSSPAEARAARLKSALKANIARRKAQACARSAGAGDTAGGQEKARDD